MKPILIRLVTVLPAMLVAMVLGVLALSAQAQNNPPAPATVNPFAEPLRQQMLDLPLPIPGMPPSSAKSASTENVTDLENLRVEYVVGEEASLRLSSSQGGNASNTQNSGRVYLVHHGEPVYIGGRKYHVTVVRERVRLFEDAHVGGKSRKGELAWAGSIESRSATSQTAGAAGAMVNQMFVGANMPSPSVKAISSSVQYGPMGVVAAGGAGAAGAAGAAAPAPR